MRVAQTHIAGLDVLGADTSKAILIKVKNAGQLAASQGALASIAAQLLPATIESKVYSTMRDKLADSLAKEHVDADVTIVEPTAWKPAGSSHIALDIGIAAAGVGVLAILWQLFARRYK